MYVTPTRIVREQFLGWGNRPIWVPKAVYQHAELRDLDNHGLTEASRCQLRVQRPDPDTGGDRDCDGDVAIGHLMMDAVTASRVYGTWVQVTGFVEINDKDFDPSGQKYGSDEPHRPYWVLEKWTQDLMCQQSDNDA